MLCCSRLSKQVLSKVIAHDYETRLKVNPLDKIDSLSQPTHQWFYNAAATAVTTAIITEIRTQSNVL